jgi:hypothetical protein
MSGLDRTQALGWECLPPSRMAEDLQSQNVLFVLEFTIETKIKPAVEFDDPVNARIEKDERNQDLKNPKSRSIFAADLFPEVAKLSESLQVLTSTTHLLQNHTEFLIAQVNQL